MIVVTGAAGFIGSCILSALNKKGRGDIIAVDHLKESSQQRGEDPSDNDYFRLKRANLESKNFHEFLEKDVFLRQVHDDAVNPHVDCLIHMGACSSTTCHDVDYLKQNNFEYTRACAQWSLEHQVRFIYASSAATYGDGSNGYADDDETLRKCEPLNAYGQSKQEFDLFALDQGWLDQIVGLKFFNVFGPNEYHKGNMRSVAAKAYPRVAQEGKIALFKSYHADYVDGEQKRDFIYVKDVVNVVLFFLSRKDINGIFNVGTGFARSWNDLANALFTACNKEPAIEYIEMPEILRERYQYFTQADMSKLKAAGYDRPFTSLEDAIKDYAGYLADGHRM